MSDDDTRPEPGSADAAAALPPQAGGQARSAYRGVAVVLAAALVIVVALAASAPFWAPGLPWAPQAAVPEAPPDPRLDQLAAALQQRERDEAALKTSLQQLDKRIGGVEAKPPPPVADLGDLRQQLAKLSSADADLTARLDALDKIVHARQQADGELAGRIDALEKAAHGEAAAGRTDAALALVLLQINGAVAAGRPFPAEYDALLGLAQGEGDLLAAAAPLAEPAKSGVASRAVLAARLRELNAAIAAPRPAADGGSTGGADGWTAWVMRQLGALVRVRRIDDGGGTGSADPAAAATADAERLLAGGDLRGAIAALEKLGGSAAEQAAPWLRMARLRLAVEEALHRSEALLTARLGAAAPGSPH